MREEEKKKRRKWEEAQKYTRDRVEKRSKKKDLEDIVLGHYPVH